MSSSTPVPDPFIADPEPRGAAVAFGLTLGFWLGVALGALL